MLVTGSEDATARLWATRTEETECLGVLKYQLKPYSQHILAIGYCSTFYIHKH